MRIRRTALRGRAFVAVAVTTLLAGSAAADTLLRARIVVDATKPSAVVLRQSLDWSAQGGAPRTELSFFLARGIDVTGVRSGGADLTVRSEDVPGAPLRRWIVRLAVPLPPGATRPLDVSSTVTTAPLPGFRANEEGGYFLPGSGWFPAIAAETDEILPHVTEIVLPEKWSGVACGAQTHAGSPWAATSPGRPYAAWGEYRTESVSSDGVTFTAWRRAGSSGTVPRLGNVAKIAAALATDLGESPGSTWKLVDVGHRVVAGGQRTLFFDESVAASADPGELTTVDRDLAGGLAAAYWDEALRFFGPQSAFLSGALPRYLGDAALVALDRSDATWRTERRLVGERRAAFLAGKAKDRPLRGLARQAQEAALILAGRGALVAHMAAEACPSPSSWIAFLRGFRQANVGGRVEWANMQRALESQFPNQHAFLPTFLETTALPDFVVVSHAPASGGLQGDRYRVEVQNRGDAAGYAEVAGYTSKDELVRTTRMFLEPGQSRAVLLGDARLIARIRIEPRGTTLQSSVDGEQVDVQTAAR